MADANGNEIIIAVDVHKWYGQFHALRGVSMTVRKGEVVVVFGPSGSGKSTFIRTINRLEEHQRGQIIVDGTELTNDIQLRELEAREDYTARLALQEEFKSLPWGAVWDYYCARAGMPPRDAWLSDIRQYEHDVLALR